MARIYDTLAPTDCNLHPYHHDKLHVALDELAAEVVVLRKGLGVIAAMPQSRKEWGQRRAALAIEMVEHARAILKRTGGA